MRFRTRSFLLTSFRCGHEKRTTTEPNIYCKRKMHAGTSARFDFGGEWKNENNKRTKTQNNSENENENMSKIIINLRCLAKIKFIKVNCRKYDRNNIYVCVCIARRKKVHMLTSKCEGAKKQRRRFMDENRLVIIWNSVGAKIDDRRKARKKVTDILTLQECPIWWLFGVAGCGFLVIYWWAFNFMSAMNNIRSSIN